MKRLLEEEQAYSFHTRRRREPVCGQCIDDLALAAFVAGDSTIGRCGFCGSTDVSTIELGSLFQYMAECLGAEWDDPINMVGWDHGYDPFVEIIDSDDLLYRADNPLGNEDLRSEFVAAFEHHWCRQDPYRLDHSEALFHSWMDFRRLTERRRRFLVTRSMPSSNPDHDELIAPEEMLDAIGASILRAEARMLPCATDIGIVRARTHKPSRILGDATALGPAPPRSARGNRMSGPGISMFYGAESEKTAIAEISPRKKQAVTFGTWTPIREFVYLDLLATHPIPSIFDMSERYERTWLRFLAEFADDLARPIDGDNVSVEYVATQIVTEYVRDHLRTTDGRPVEGIRYPSAVDKPNGVCWVVFFGHDECVNSSGDEPSLLVLDADSVCRRGPR